MISFRKHYIKKREQNLKKHAYKHIILIFNKNILAHPNSKTKQIAPIQQTFMKYIETRISSGGNILHVIIKDQWQVEHALQTIALNLIAIQIENKWYTGPLIKKSRFEKFRKQLLLLLIMRRELLNK